MQGYQQNFRLGIANRRDQRFFLFGQPLNFFYRLLQRVFAKTVKPGEEDWEASNTFDFTGQSYSLLQNT